MFFVYVLQSLKDGRTYVGYTDNFERRFNQHNNGRSTSTRSRAPFKLLFKESFNRGVDAKRRELWWKSGAGRKKLREYFENAPYVKMVRMQIPTGVFNDPMKPMRTELRIWAHGDYSDPVSNFQLFVMSDPDLALDFAADPRCAKRDFFLESLYVWMGDQVRSGLPNKEIVMKILGSAEEIPDERIKKFAERSRELILDPYGYDSDKWGIGGSYAGEL